MATGYSRSQNYNSSCRLCLTNTLKLVPIFGTPDGGLSQKIFACLSIKVSEYDGLPKCICHKCECQVNVWHYFKEECELTQKKLNEWQGYSHSSSIYVSESSENVDEAVYIKQEPEDDVMHVEHHINHNVTFDAHIENSHNLNECSSNEAVVESYSASENQDETNSPFTLVISGTTSVAPEENSPRNVLDSDVKDSCDIENTGNSNSFCDRETTDVVCVGTSKPERTIIEVHLDDSNDARASLTTNSILNLVMNLHSLLQVDSKIDNATGISSTLPVSADDSKEPFPIKKEPLDITDKPESKPKNIMSLLAEPVTKPTTVLYNSQSFDLPKIENHIFDEKTNFCKFCSKSFQNISNLWRHVKDKHAKDNPFRCPACRKIFPGRRELVAHRVKTVSKFCRAGRVPNLDFPHSSVITHSEITNGKVGRYECSHCNHKFGQLNATLAHVIRHTGEKPFFCYKCNKDFHLRKSAWKHVAGCPGKIESLTVVPVGKLKLLPKLSKVLKGPKLKSKVNPTLIKDNTCSKCQNTFENATEFCNHSCKICISCSKFIPIEMLQKHFSLCFKASGSETKSEISTCSTSSAASSISDLETRVKNEETKQDNVEESTSKVKKKRKSHFKITQKVDLSRQELWAKNHDKDGNLILNCHICLLKFSSRKSLYCHLLKHSSKAFKCKFEQCSSSHLMWSMRASFEAHMLNVHGMSQSDLKEEFTSNAERTTEPTVSSKSKPPGKYSAVKLKCDTCFKLCSSVSSLKFHKLTHKKITCKKCEITFPASMERAHVCLPKVKVVLLSDQPIPDNQPPILPEKRPNQYTCHLCKKKFHTKKILYQHKKMHIKMKIYKCNVCENSYSDSAALQSHKELHHPYELDTPCVKDEMNKSPEGTGKQIKEETKTTDKQWKCTRCSRSYSHRVTLQRHMKLHRWRKPKNPSAPNDPDRLYCGQCNRTFESKGSYNSHQGWHSRQVHSTESSATPSKVEPPVSIQNIGVTTQSVEGKSISSSLSLSFDTFGCDICSKKFASQRNLNIHMVYHRKGKSTTVEDSNSKGVVQDVTEGDKLTLKCEICAQTFSDLSEFTSHSTVHTASDTSTVKSEVLVEAPKPEQLHCKLCNKEYRCKKSLKYHMMGHSGEKPYKCKSCSNQYSNPNALAKHERDRHTPILRPFSCNRCKTSFILKEDLLAHREKCTH
ncbi:Zinc finger protein 729 [Frankliniella fusca]|uniref:Zinc finger protein 729 n=1 Tax=Frankliniella fusca TaxID=407009 RepID=A0AAE1L9C5_9NEOP|nr:Zinc finger protein 729 [Frankliniella fusca]